MANQKQIRNFCVISHIDHGKSTLADRFLELTGTIEKRKMKKQYLDMMDLEREKGITIKLQPVRMEYKSYILNLIDTPGHVDFSYEVSRSLAAVEGAILLVDASQGIQAQTLANLNLAKEQKLVIIPVINKIDLADEERIKEVEGEIINILEDSEEILRISAKRGDNIDKVLEAVIEKVPAPSVESKKPLRALIFDSSFDSYKGAIAYVRVIDGEIKTGEKIELMASEAQSEVIEVGVFRPQFYKTTSLKAGEIGYIATGLRGLEDCRVGDTIIMANNQQLEPLTGYKASQSMIFASIYPQSADDHDLLKESLSKLRLNDASLKYEPESSDGLGRGFRSGFLGMLHMEIVLERLKREYNLNLIVTTPSVEYRVRTKDEKYISVSSPQDLPEANRIEYIEEPWATLEIVSPVSYLGQIMRLLEKVRGEYGETKYLSDKRILTEYRGALNEVIVDFYDKLKNATAGYASMSYELEGYHRADLEKLDVLVAGDEMSVFSRIVHKDKIYSEGRALVKKLKEAIPSQLFSVSLQAVVGGKVIARETITAHRKDVTGYLYGGDYTRKKKLLEKQKKGKKKMKSMGKVNIPQEVFFKVLKG